MTKNVLAILPIGGVAKRLNYLGGFTQKCMLPQAGYNAYHPIISHTIEKLNDAGVTSIALACKEYTSSAAKICNYLTIWSRAPVRSLANKDTFSSCITLNEEEDKDFNYPERIILALPDTIYEGNPFRFLSSGDDSTIRCALYNTHDPELKVDRLSKDGTQFFVKSAQHKLNTNEFWGSISVSRKHFTQIAELSKEYSEVGDIINKLGNFEFHRYNKFLDLGTWENLNYYWRNYSNYDFNKP